MQAQLKPTLGKLHLWGIAVGLVISGEYFGWSYGWGAAGTLGFLVTTLLVAAMITMSVFGALVMYMMSMLSLFRLRRTAPEMERTFRAPLYPFAPALALCIAIVCLIAMVYFNFILACIFTSFMAGGFIYFQFTQHQRTAAPQDALLAS